MLPKPSWLTAMSTHIQTRMREPAADRMTVRVYHGSRPDDRDSVGLQPGPHLPPADRIPLGPRGLGRGRHHDPRKVALDHALDEPGQVRVGVELGDQRGGLDRLRGAHSVARLVRSIAARLRATHFVSDRFTLGSGRLPVPTRLPLLSNASISPDSRAIVPHPVRWDLVS